MGAGKSPAHQFLAKALAPDAEVIDADAEAKTPDANPIPLLYGRCRCVWSIGSQWPVSPILQHLSQRCYCTES